MSMPLSVAITDVCLDDNHVVLAGVLQCGVLRDAGDFGTALQDLGNLAEPENVAADFTRQEREPIHRTWVQWDDCFVIVMNRIL